jgi:hypothetical protein
MKKITSIFLLIFLSGSNVFSNNEMLLGFSDFEKQVLTFDNQSCKNIKQTDIPAIFIP